MYKDQTNAFANDAIVDDSDDDADDDDDDVKHLQIAMEWGTEDQDGTIRPESLADNCTLAELKELFIKKNVVGRSKSTDKLVLAKILCSEAKTMIVTKSENGEEDRKAIIPVMI